jgi:hypothetical protein
LFVAVTALCCWLGWELSIVRQRERTVQELKPRGVQFVKAEEFTSRPAIPGLPSEQPARVPMLRRWLGDKAVQQIWHAPHLVGQLSEHEIRRIKRVFPEATFHESHPEPCHPGCFPQGTLVETSSGPKAIEELGVGDEVITVAADGATAFARIETVFTTRNTLWKIVTDEATLLTTRTQPLCTANRTIVPAGDLEAGQQLLVWREGGLQSASVREVSATARSEKVFNLILGDSQTFIAGGFLARSKPPAPLQTAKSTE